MTWPIATTFDNPSTNADEPSVAQNGDWTISFSCDREWSIDAQRGQLVVPMRVAKYYEPAEVAAYVRDKLGWIDAPPAQAVEVEG